MTKKHRLFFALEPDEKVRREIHAVQKKLDCNGRKVPENQFHITLAFLGMQPAEMIPEVSAIASRVPFSPCSPGARPLRHIPPRWRAVDWNHDHSGCPAELSPGPAG